MTERIHRGLTANSLKLIAAASMFIDHLGMMVFPGVPILRIMGRLAFPIFAYFIFIGCQYTHAKGKYFLRLFFLGLFCMGVYYLIFRKIAANILITFSMSMVLIYAIQLVEKTSQDAAKRLFPVVGASILTVVLILVVYAICAYIPVDYGFIGVLVPVLAELCAVFWPKYARRAQPLHVTPMLVGFALGLLLLALRLRGTQYYALASLLLLVLYNGTTGRLRLQSFFYFFYPLHFLPIWLLTL